MRPGYKYLSRMPLYPSQTLFNMHAEAVDHKEVECIYNHIAKHNMLQHPNYIDIVDLLGTEEPYGPYNEIGIQERINAYLVDCKQWGEE
ncbi:hypothetical protein [Bacillus wiedmannii]|uniref:hypothetical protein n=1 Tax=Bacillus wiedmannii TaxID=1890302 RepID=UPI002E22F169|nr:hypothetical protein [Bacillus wiedmannii]